MPRLRCRDEGVSTPVLLYITFLIIAFIAAGAYVGTRPEEEVPREVRSLTITADSPVTAGQSSSITVEAKDAEGNPVPGADISLSYTIPSARESWEVALQLVNQGDGSYTSSLTSQWAGNYNVAAWVEGTTIRASSDVTVIPGEIADVVIHSTSPRPALSWYTSELTFYFVDQYGNIDAPPDDPNVGWPIFLGDVTHDNRIFGVSLNADNWGTTEVTITDNNTGVSASKQIEFTPAYVDLSYNLVEPTVEFTSFENLEFVSSGDNQFLSLDVGIFFPSGLGTLGKYDLRVEYDSSAWGLVSVTDPDPTDNFEAPEMSTSDNVIHLSQVGSATEPGVSVATILFKPWEWVKEKAGKFITWVENLWDDLMGPVETPPGQVEVDGKVFQKLFIPIKTWIVEGSGVTEADVASDKKRAEDMLNRNARACRLKYWYIFLNEYNYISEDEWDSKVPDGDIEGTEGVPDEKEDNQRKKLIEQNKWERWVNVYYVPDNSFVGMGWYTDNVIFIKDNADSDNLTLAHELVHEFSKSDVLDGPRDAGPRAKRQGALKPGNIMNYDNTGENISENQGKLIDGSTENNSEERPAGEGGGRIYKPTAYVVEPTLGQVHVGGIETGYEHFEGYSYAKAWVTAEDAEGNPVAGATVIAEVDRPDGTKPTESEITGSDGVALLSHYTIIYGDYTFTVTDVQVEGMQYDPDANVVSIASVTLA